MLHHVVVVILLGGLVINGQLQTFPFTYNSFAYNPGYMQPIDAYGTRETAAAGLYHPVDYASFPVHDYNLDIDPVFHPHNRVSSRSYARTENFVRSPRLKQTGSDFGGDYQGRQPKVAKRKRKGYSSKKKYRKKSKKSKKRIKYQTYPGFFVKGGSQVHGKIWSLRQCQKTCKRSPDCFSGDFNRHQKKCYLHSNTTACNTMETEHAVTHFQKIPCIAPETPNGRVILGVQVHGGIETKAKSITDCIHQCANMGSGIATTHAILVAGFKQICAAIDYDFATKKCYIHGNALVFCPANVSPPILPRDLVSNPTVVHVILCPPVV